MEKNVKVNGRQELGLINKWSIPARMRKLSQLFPTSRAVDQCCSANFSSCMQNMENFSHS